MTNSGKPLPQSSPSRTRTTVALLTVGLGLNLRASILLGPHLHDRLRLSGSWYVALIVIPIVIGALVRLPAGVLTDRYGARVTMPAVSLAAAGSVIGLGLSNSVPLAVFFGALCGAANAAFVAGAALLARASPYGRRGRTLGVFGLGVGLAAVLSAVSWCFDTDGRLAAIILSGLLTAFAGVAAAVLRDPPHRRRTGSFAGTCLTMVRLAATDSVSLLYMLALSGIVSIALFLPVYLSTALDFGWFHSLAVTVCVVAAATVARLAGGWRTDRRPTARLLTVCYGIAAGLCVLVALAPHTWLTIPAIAGIAVCDGLASGALLALIGKACRPDSAGAVLGVTGAAGSLGALLPPLLFAGLHRLTHSDTMAWTLLAAVLLAGALYVRARGLFVGLGLAVEFEPEPSPTRLTVAVLGESDTSLGAPAVVSHLAELATSDELVVVYGSGERSRSGLSPRALAGGLRHRLPRHSVVVARVAERPEALGRDALLLTEHIDAGALTIAVTPAAQVTAVAADLSIYLQADRVLTVSFDPAEGTSVRNRE